MRQLGGTHPHGPKQEQQMDPAPTPPRTRRPHAWRRLARITALSALRGAAAAVGSGAVTVVIWWWQK
ncbi:MULTISPECIES: hypothetical protein [Streptomyces]|uniref:Uncharacterized protein n=1 Tax=Streptomyces osmaniensis TaxID=593134 RepID=A0ABP6XAP5_9ACTN|nr:hypothetical protein KJK32_29755 [Streptomyces sp. JCM17656]